MSPETVVTVGRHALEMTLMLAAPLLLTALGVGLIVGIFQAATQINEATLSFIPKLLAVFATIVIAGPWMIGEMVDYIRQLFGSIPTLVG
jgi:flagellar biosynthetic protein FliQ